jgi:aldose 1-epimerase
MPRIALEHGGMRVEIDPDLGAGIADLSWSAPGRPSIALMRRAPANLTWFNDLGCYLLAPWSNRVAGAEFEWRGSRHQLAADWPDGTPIHGLVKDRAWSVEQRSPTSAVLTCDVPAAAFAWPFSARVGYMIVENSLRVALEVRNDGGPGVMPAGMGFHPFWNRSLDGGADEVVVRLPGLRRYPCEGMIPVGLPREDDTTLRLAVGTTLDGLTLDDVFAGSADGADIAWPRSGVHVRYRCSHNLGHTVMFTGEQGSFCLEPVSMVNNGFNLTSKSLGETGVRALAKGESMSVEWTIEVDRI